MVVLLSCSERYRVSRLGLALDSSRQEPKNASPLPIRWYFCVVWMEVALSEQCRVKSCCSSSGTMGKGISLDTNAIQLLCSCHVFMILIVHIHVRSGIPHTLQAQLAKYWVTGGF